jgi:hypothetical protein
MSDHQPASGPTSRSRCISQEVPRSGFGTLFQARLDVLDEAIYQEAHELDGSRVFSELVQHAACETLVARVCIVANSRASFGHRPRHRTRAKGRSTEILLVPASAVKNYPEPTNIARVVSRRLITADKRSGCVGNRRL